MNTIQIRSMQVSDLAQVMAIQSQCYLQLPPESLACYQAKLAASADTCFVARLQEEIIAYMIALPWDSSAPPAFDAPSCELPKQTDCFYLHDLAVSPAARQHKVGSLLVAKFFDTAKALDFAKTCLIAVDGAHTYWQRFGFVQQTDHPAMTTKLAEYGEQAQFMQRILA